jgi:two-component system, cell cycle sensor histidine kinase and response regulator CckA
MATNGFLHGKEHEMEILRTLIDNLPDGIFLKDRQSRFVFANQVIAELMGARDASVLSGKTDHDFYPKEVADSLLAEEQIIVKTHRSSVNKEESKSLTNGLRRILTTKVPVVDTRGEVTGLLGITRDITERNNVEEKLRVGERRYRDLLEQAADGVFLLDEKGDFLMANAAICEMLGYASEELLRLNILDTYPQELLGMGKSRFDAIKSGEASRFERPTKRKDGSVFPVEMSTRGLADGTTQGIAHDITERKRREVELALERSLLSALMENIPDKIYFKDTQSQFIRTSKAHAWSFGLRDAKEAIGKTDMDFFSEEHAMQAYEDEQRIIRTGEPILNVEEKETWPNRPDTWVLTTKMPLRDQEGKIIGSFGISRDITEHKRAEERIQSLARFPDENPQPIMRVTPDGAVLYANKASEPLISSWAGKEDGEIPKEYLHALTHVWESGEKQEIEISEATRTYAITIVPIVAAGYANIYGRDVTEEKTLAQRLNQAQKMEAIGQLTGGVAHDFNNVLQAITGYCEVLKLRLPEENLKFVAEIMKATQRAATLTGQLLAFSRNQILRPQIVDTKDIVHSIQKMLERVIGEDIELRTLIDFNTGNFLADPGQLEQVLLNLAVNARDAMPLGGKLTIETTNRTFDEAYVHDHPGARVGQYVRIAVSDTGVGMDKETLSHIYEPFFTTKEKGKGTGLGLSTVYGIVKQSEGYINCYSELGSGTTFTIYLPLTLREADKPQIAVSHTTAPRGTETILLVDDDSAVRSVARIALEEAGYVVVEASGGEEALSEVLARSIAVELLITDVVMPRMSGKELSLKLKEILREVRVLYISGYTANVISHHGILEAGVDYLQKPFSSFEFLTKVRDILDRP